MIWLKIYQSEKACTCGVLLMYLVFFFSLQQIMGCYPGTSSKDNEGRNDNNGDGSAADGSGNGMNTDAGSDSDSDSDADSDTDTDSDSDNDSDQEPCWCDTATGLCWQNPPGDIQMNWYTASGKKNDEYNPEGVPGYCEYNEWGGYNDWRLPDIDELISLIRGCVDGKDTGDLSTCNCGLKDPECMDVYSDYCYDDKRCVGCVYLQGPSEDGCYWHPGVEGKCSWYWSSSSNIRDDPSEWDPFAWGVNFLYGEIDLEYKSEEKRHVCCVRPCP